MSIFSRKNKDDNAQADAVEEAAEGYREERGIADLVASEAAAAETESGPGDQPTEESEPEVKHPTVEDIAASIYNLTKPADTDDVQ